MASQPDYSQIENYPLLAPPPGVTPNFTNPESRNYQIFITAGVCLPTVLVFAGLRFYAKFVLMRKRTRDDYVYVISLSAAITYIAMIMTLVTGPYGRHSWNVTIGSLNVPVIRLSLVAEVIYGPLIWLIKLSLFVLFLEIFGRLRWLRYSIYLSGTITGLFYFSSLITLLVLCAPRDGQSQESYLSAIASDRCAQNKPVNVVMGSINIASDFFLLIVPLPVVWSLQLPTRRKFGVSAIILTGIAACACSILGLIYRVYLDNNAQDNTWDVIPLWIVTIVEMSAGVMIPCMPSIAVVNRRLSPPVFSYFESYRQKLLSLMTSSTQVTYDKDTESTIELHSRLNSNDGRYRNSGQPTIAPGLPSQERRAGRAIPDATHIRKTTEIKMSDGPYEPEDHAVPFAV